LGGVGSATLVIVINITGRLYGQTWNVTILKFEMQYEKVR